MQAHPNHKSAAPSHSHRADLAGLIDVHRHAQTQPDAPRKAKP